MKLFKKLKREIVVGLSKLGLRQASSNYYGLKLKFPVLYGMGRGYVIPAEPWMSDCIRVFTDTKPGCIIDVGANVGVYLVKLKAIRDDIPYYGFEPNHSCNFYTQELIRLNKFTQAKIFPFALSDKREVITLYASKRGDKTASIIEQTKQNQSTEFSNDILTMEGDEFINFLGINEISAIKIDVEGAESYVLNGLKGTIKRARPYIYCEMLSSQNSSSIKQIWSFLDEINYNIFGVTTKEKKLQILSSSNEVGNKYSPEYIFVPNEQTPDFLKHINKHH